jgi:hypothetical protein
MKPRRAAKVTSIGPVAPSPEAARKIALYEAPGFLAVERAQAAEWLLRQLDAGYMDFHHRTMSEDALEGWARTIAEDAIREALATAQQEIADAVSVGKAGAA